MRCSRKNSYGFTLIELLIVICILSVISLTIYSILNNGIKIWQRVNAGLPEEDQEIFFYKFGHDISNVILFHSIPFIGQQYRLEFASLVDFQSVGAKTVGKIVYTYNPQDKILSKSVSDFSQGYNNEESLQAQVLSRIKSFSFKYYFYDTNKKQFLWLDNWTQDTPPSAVRLEIEFQDSNDAGKISRTVSIPVAGGA
jgi:prepilin-type N-terminal cleavage/methylation domain-containing protein